MQQRYSLVQSIQPYPPSRNHTRPHTIVIHKHSRAEILNKTKQDNGYLVCEDRMAVGERSTSISSFYISSNVEDHTAGAADSEGSNQKNKIPLNSAESRNSGKDRAHQLKSKSAQLASSSRLRPDCRRRSNHLRFPGRVSKCEGIDAGSCPFVTIVLCILLR